MGQSLEKRMTDIEYIIAHLPDDLNARFAGVDVKLATIRETQLLHTQRFSTLERRIDGLEVRVAGLESRMDRLETKMDKLERRMDSFETKMDKLEGRMDSLETKMGNLEIKVDALGGKLDLVLARLPSS